MRILMLQDSYPPYVGGCARACEAMSAGLAARGNRVHVLTTELGRGASTPGVTVHATLESTPARPLHRRLLAAGRRRRRNLAALAAAVAEARPDVVVVWNLWRVSDAVLHAVHRLGLPVVYYLHDDWLTLDRRARWDILWSREAARADLRLLKRALRALGVEALLERCLARWFAGAPRPPRAQSLVFVSASCRDEHRARGWETDGAAIVGNGIDMTRFRPADRSRAAGGTTRILFAGRIEPLKGVEVLVRALATLGDRAWVLDLVGPVVWAPYRAELEALIAREGLGGRVRLPGALDAEDMAACYLDHDLLVFPSTGTERLPLVVIEAMACALPVVSTLTGGHAEFLEHERNCLVVRPGDVDDLAAALARMIGDAGLRARLGDAGAADVRARFDAPAVHAQMERLLAAQVVDGNAPARVVTAAAGTTGAASSRAGDDRTPPAAVAPPGNEIGA